ncbi:hypothetical protein DEX24_06520 [Kurthia sibirica]|uniref:Uncharacterized protein n=1 Tax=Kurthia sibirica TaxID=202750 RepID=A0A2U3AMT0_9BACL|nr:hypothetical protein DEX24_06520 [Kurthia sibirica]
MFTFKQRGVCLFVMYFTFITLSLNPIYSNAFLICSHIGHIESDNKIAIQKTYKIRQKIKSSYSNHYHFKVKNPHYFIKEHKFLSFLFIHRKATHLLSFLIRK